MNGATDKSVAELKERIQVLEKELDNANELLSSSKLRGSLGLSSLHLFTLWTFLSKSMQKNFVAFKISQHQALQGFS